jgi:GNAT superfamily N-acetyltransferase
LIRIRAATIDDAAAISALIRPLAEKYISFEFSSQGAEALLNSLSASAMEGYFQTHIIYHVGEANDGLVGVVGMRNNSHLYHLFVAEAFQRQGIAKKLWDVAQEVSRQRGHTGSYTVNASRCSVAVYRKFGFSPSGPLQTRNDVTYFPMVTCEDGPH